MATSTIRYLVRVSGRDGLPRYFWQPSSLLRREGWRPERVPANWADYTDPDLLEAAAIARAKECNQFLDAARAKAAAPEVKALTPMARSVGALIKEYQASDAYTGLAPSTRRSYQQCLSKIATWAADAPVAAIDEIRIKRLKRGLSATPAYSNAVIRVLRLLLEFGRRELKWLTRNPAERPNLAGSEPSGVIWPREAVELFVKTADAAGYHSMGTAVMLNEWLGQRQGDILRMPRAALRLDGGTLVVRQSKGGRSKAGVALPIGMVPALARRLAEELERLRLAEQARRQKNPKALLPSTIIVSEETGLPYKTDNFRHVFARVRAKMGEDRKFFPVEHLMPGRDMADPGAFTVLTADLTFQQLRHTAVTRLAESGCDTTLISAVSGHAQSTVHELMERYMVRTAAMARTAFQRRMDAEAPAPNTDAEDAG